MNLTEFKELMREMALDFFVSLVMSDTKVPPEVVLQGFLERKLEKFLVKASDQAIVILDGRSKAAPAEVVAVSTAVRVLSVIDEHALPVVHVKDLKGLKANELLETLSDLLAPSLQTGSISVNELHKLI